MRISDLLGPSLPPQSKAPANASGQPAKEKDTQSMPGARPEERTAALRAGDRRARNRLLEEGGIENQSPALAAEERGGKRLLSHSGNDNQEPATKQARLEQAQEAREPIHIPSDLKHSVKEMLKLKKEAGRQEYYDDEKVLIIKAYRACRDKEKMKEKTFMTSIMGLKATNPSWLLHLEEEVKNMEANNTAPPPWRLRNEIPDCYKDREHWEKSLQDMFAQKKTTRGKLELSLEEMAAAMEYMERWRPTSTAFVEKIMCFSRGVGSPYLRQFEKALDEHRKEHGKWPDPWRPPFASTSSSDPQHSLPG
jgi:hypothetical protein